MLDKGDSVGLVACSDGFPNDNHEVIEEVENSLYDMGYKAVIGNIYCTKENRTLSSRDRADVFNEMVRNPEIKVVLIYPEAIPLMKFLIMLITIC